METRFSREGENSICEHNHRNPIEEPKHDKLSSDNVIFRFDDAPDAQTHSPQTNVVCKSVAFKSDSC